MVRSKSEMPGTRANGMRAFILTFASIVLVATDSAPVSPGNQKSFCRGEVAGKYGTKPIYVTAGKLQRARNGTTLVSGTVDMGTEGIKKFKCRFDSRGRFVDVMALTPDGE